MIYIPVERYRDYIDKLRLISLTPNNSICFASFASFASLDSVVGEQVENMPGLHFHRTVGSMYGGVVTVANGVLLSSSATIVFFLHFLISLWRKYEQPYYTILSF